MHRIPQQPLKPQKRLSGRIDSAQTLCRKAVQLVQCKRQSPVSRSEGLEISQVVLKHKDEILGQETRYYICL